MNSTMCKLSLVSDSWEVILQKSTQKQNVILKAFNYSLVQLVFKEQNLILSGINEPS